MGRKQTDLVALTVRMREDLRRKIDREAAKRDLSLNNEIIRLVERAYEYERAFGSDRTQILLRFIGVAITMIERGTGKRWNETPEMLEPVLDSVRLIARAAGLSGMEPGERPDDDEELESLKQRVPGGAAVVEMVAGDQELHELTERDVAKDALKEFRKA